MKSKIQAISYYLPELVLSNEVLASNFPDWSVEKIASKTGIENRHVSGPQETVSDMAVSSCQKLFEENNIQAKDIDFIILCTQSPDYYLPSTSCIIQERLGIPTTSGAFDFNLGCSGYIYGLGVAKGLIETEQAKNVLLVTSEIYTKHIHPGDKGNLSLFGDAASATLIVPSETDSIDGFVYGTDGRGAKNLIVNNGGLKYPSKNGTAEDFLFMNGAEIFTFTLSAVPALVEQVLYKSKMKKDEIDLYIFHQANKFMLESIRKKIGIAEEKFFYFLKDVGNTVSSTIPIALANAISSHRITSNMKVMVVGFGVGYSWAGCILNYKQ